MKHFSLLLVTISFLFSFDASNATFQEYKEHIGNRLDAFSILKEEENINFDKDFLSLASKWRFNIEAGWSMQSYNVTVVEDPVQTFPDDGLTEAYPFIFNLELDYKQHGLILGYNPIPFVSTNDSYTYNFKQYISGSLSDDINKTRDFEGLPSLTFSLGYRYYVNENREGMSVGFNMIIINGIDLQGSTDDGSTYSGTVVTTELSAFQKTLDESLVLFNINLGYHWNYVSLSLNHFLTDASSLGLTFEETYIQLTGNFDWDLEL